MLAKTANVDDADLYNGAPVGLQLVGRRLQEEKVLALTDVVVAALEGF